MKKIIALMVVFAFFGCARDPEHKEVVNKNFIVDTLFTYDGITIYRFSDAGHYVYFTRRGDVYQSYTQSTGKSAYTRRNQTLGDDEP